MDTLKSQKKKKKGYGYINECSQCTIRVADWNYVGKMLTTHYS